MIGAILDFILGAVEKLLPFFLAFKVGKDKVEKDDLKETVRQGEVRNEIESQNAGRSRADIIGSLRDSQSKQSDL